MKIIGRTAGPLRYVCLVWAFGCIFSSAGCARPGEEIEARNPAPGNAPTNAPALANQEEKLSYALGMVLGNQFRDQGVEVDQGRYAQGLRDALAGGRTLLTESEARAAVGALQGELKRRQSTPPSPAVNPTGIEVSFKLDPRLTRSMYMGDRWVSPPTFTSTVQAGTEMTIEARARGTGPGGRSLPLQPEWIPEDPEMVAVSPAQGDQVKITVKRPGQSRLTVVAPGISAELRLKAIYQGDTVQVEISR